MTSGALLASSAIFSSSVFLSHLFPQPPQQYPMVCPLNSRVAATFSSAFPLMGQTLFTGSPAMAAHAAAVRVMAAGEKASIPPSGSNAHTKRMDARVIRELLWLMGGNTHLVGYLAAALGVHRSHSAPSGAHVGQRTFITPFSE